MNEPTDEGSPQLRQLSAEVDRIARALAKLSQPKSSEPPPNVVERRHQPDRRAQPDRRDGARAEMLATLRAIMRARRMRAQFFNPDLFADPAWDMLIDLLHARLEQRPVAVSSLCIAAAVPPTTALRWIKRLTDEGIFVRTADPHDGRRIFIDLSEPAAESMTAYVQQVGRMGFGFLQE